MDMALLVSAGIAVAGVVLTVAFLPQTNAATTEIPYVRAETEIAAIAVQ